MDKGQTIHQFWNNFEWKAYDETTVPEDAQFPYITYTVKTDSIDNKVQLSASLWDRSTSWARVSQKAEEISEFIVEMYPASVEINNGRLYITKDTPFAQRMMDDDDTIRRIYLMINVEYLTNY